MNNLIMIGVLTGQLLGTFRVTAYRSVPEQTDDSPFITSTGETVCSDGVAASRDLLRSGVIKYGDWIYVEGAGLKRVNDSLGEDECIRRNKQGKCVERKLIRNQWDLWVPSKEEESKVWRKFGNNPVRVWKVEIVETPR